MTKQQEVAIETAVYYGTDPSRRGMDGQKCVYIVGDHIDDNNTMCAVGRCLTGDSLLKVIEKDVRGGSVQELVESLGPISKLVKPKYKRLGLKFWGKLQDFHDTPNYFTKNCISDLGYNNLKDSFKLSDAHIQSIKDQIAKEKLNLQLT